MISRLPSMCRRPRTAVAVVLYSFVILAAAFEHHDLLCHLQHPQHCTACAASQPSGDPHALTPPQVAHLVDAGLATTTGAVAVGALLPVRSSGRSPPAFA